MQRTHRMRISGIAAVAVFCLVMATGMARAQESPASTASQFDLVINEFMASNDSTIEDPDEPGEYPDWLELFNPTDAPVSLDGLYLIQGTGADVSVYAVPPGLTVGAQGFLVFFADDDPSQGPLHTNFRLNRSEDTFGLYADPEGIAEIDSHSYTDQETDQSEGRDPDGGPNWRRFDRPTPNTWNSSRPPRVTSVGHAPTLPTATQAVEVTADISDESGISSAVVVYQPSGGPEQSVEMAWTGDGNRYRGTIPPQTDGVIVTYYVMATDNDGETTPNLSAGAPPYMRYAVGYEIPTVIINEFMADNQSILEDPDDPGDFADWIELYNPGPSPVPLGNLFLSDDPENPTKFAITDTLTLDPGQYLIFLADEDPEQGPLHTNFRLSREAETVALYGAQGVVEIDRIDFVNMPTNIGYGRLPNAAADAWQLLFCPTPGAENAACPARTLLPIVRAP